MTPLHMAAERGYIKIVDYLVGKGADIDIQDKNGVICDFSNNNVVIGSFHVKSTQSKVDPFRFWRYSGYGLGLWRKQPTSNFSVICHMASEL